jgi:hypothetical protein
MRAATVSEDDGTSAQSTGSVHKEYGVEQVLHFTFALIELAGEVVNTMLFAALAPLAILAGLAGGAIVIRRRRRR